MPDERPAARRADAQQNRTKLLEVAAGMLAADGETSLNAIAKAAGVGPGTLYRHFPTREALILAVYQHDVLGLVDEAPRLLEEHPPLDALAAWYRKLTAHIRLKHGLGDALTATEKAHATEKSYGPVIAATTLILDAGVADGTIRAGVDPDDVLLLMSALWRTPQTADGQAQIDRLLATITRSIAA
ncbi:MAG: TetR family transcriptional regulator [Solirubrobacteraceae bacterium]|nr:TetR family transcriptional regulator [Patulibacter sp.]